MHINNASQAHSAERDLKLYAGWFCPFVQRVWIALEEKGIPYQYIEVNPYHKPQSLLDLNPRGIVPTLQYQGKPLYLYASDRKPGDRTGDKFKDVWHVVRD